MTLHIFPCLFFGCLVYEMDVDLTEDEIEEAFSGIFDKTVPNELHVHSLRFAATYESEIDQHLLDRIPSKTRSKL